MNDHMNSVELKKAFRLINHGPTVLLSARHGSIDNVMAVAWCCGMDIDPPKLNSVVDKLAQTRSFIETSGVFVVQVPTVAELALTREVGSRTLYEEPNKLQKSGVSIFEVPRQNLPFVKGCSAWLACRLINEPHFNGIQ